MRKIKKLTIYEWILCGILGLEVLYLVYCNLVHIPDVIEPDIAKMLYHTMEMARQSRIVLPDWIYTTTAEWDTVVLPAVLFYKITGDVCLSFGIVNCINMALFFLVVDRLLRQAGMERLFRLLALALLFGLYDMDEVWYTTEMLFSGGAQYYYKVLVPLLLLTVLTAQEQERRGWENRVLLLVFSVTCMITAASSGIYVFLCGLLPIIVCYVVFRYRDRYVWGVIGLTVVLTVAGLMACNALGVSPGSSTEMDLRTLNEVTEAPLETFSTFLQVWNLFPKYPTPVLSVVGIGTVAKFVLIGVLLPFGFGGLRDVLGIRSLRRDAGEPDVSGIVRACLVTIFAWNYFILFLTFSTPRYQLIGAIPLMLCAVFGLQDVMKNRVQPWVCKALAVIAGVLLLFIGAAAVTYGEEEHFHRRDAMPGICATIKEQLEEAGIQTVLWLNCREMSEMMRYYDPSGRMYSNLMVSPEGEITPFNWNTYKAAEDPSMYEDLNAVIATKEDFLRLPEEMRAPYEELSVVPIYVGNNLHGDYRIYRADRCPITGF